MSAEKLRQENNELRAMVDNLLKQQQQKKERVDQFLTNTFSTTESLKSEVKVLQETYANLVKELNILKQSQLQLQRSKSMINMRITN